MDCDVFLFMMNTDDGLGLFVYIDGHEMEWINISVCVCVTVHTHRVAVKVCPILSSPGQWTTEPSMAASGCGRRWAGSSSLTDR